MTDGIEDHELRVISYNVHSCVGIDSTYSVDRIARVLESERPDVVCIQETEVNRVLTKTRVWSTPHKQDQPGLIADALGFKHRRFARAVRSVARSSYEETFGTNEEDGNMGDFGIAILSKYPILRSVQHDYHVFEKKTPRNAVACLIELPEGKCKVWVVNTHLGVHYRGKEQLQQAMELKTFIQSLVDDSEAHASGLILCGDFNSLPFYRSVKVVKSSTCGAVDLWEEKGTGPGATFPSAGFPGLYLCSSYLCMPMLRLDFIFFVDMTRKKRSSSKNDDGGTGTGGHENAVIVPKLSFVMKGSGDGGPVDMKASDHLPLCAIFAVNK